MRLGIEPENWGLRGVVVLPPASSFEPRRGRRAMTLSELLLSCSLGRQLGDIS